MVYAGLGGDLSLVDKLFFIFSDLENKLMDFRVLLIGLEIFTDSGFEKKLSIFIEIADIQDEGFINEKLIYQVLKVICNKSDQKSRLRKFCKLFFI